MGAIELTTGITVLANAICQGLSIDEMALIAGVFVQLGDTIATIAAQKNICQIGEEKKATQD